MRIPYGFELISDGTLEVNKDEANIVSMIFDFYMAGASLGKVVDMVGTGWPGAYRRNHRP